MAGLWENRQTKRPTAYTFVLGEYQWQSSSNIAAAYKQSRVCHKQQCVLEQDAKFSMSNENSIRKFFLGLQYTAKTKAVIERKAHLLQKMCRSLRYEDQVALSLHPMWVKNKNWHNIKTEFSCKRKINAQGVHGCMTGKGKTCRGIGSKILIDCSGLPLMSSIYCCATTHSLRFQLVSFDTYDQVFRPIDCCWHLCSAKGGSRSVNISRLLLVLCPVHLQTCNMYVKNCTFFYRLV